MLRNITAVKHVVMVMCVTLFTLLIPAFAIAIDDRSDIFIYNPFWVDDLCMNDGANTKSKVSCEEEVEELLEEVIKEEIDSLESPARRNLRKAKKVTVHEGGVKR